MTARRVPDFPAGLLADPADPVQALYHRPALDYARARWVDFWRSSLGRACLGSDYDDLYQWASWVYRRALYELLVKAQPVVQGPNGPVPHPLEATIQQLSARITNTLAGVVARHKAAEAEAELATLERAARPSR